MRKRPDRVLGPYRIGPTKWRNVIVRDGTRTPGPLFDTREEAERSKARIEAALAQEQAAAPVTFRAALDLYLTDCRERGLREGTIDTIRRRVETYLETELYSTVRAFTEAKAKLLLSDLATRPSRWGKPYSAAWIKVSIVGLRTFGKFLTEGKHWKENLFLPLKHKGKMNKGKNKLTLDEARIYAKAAHDLADAGDEGAVQALCALYLGLRKGEILDLTARSLDDRGRRLIVFRSKTDAGKRTVALPPQIRPYLAQLAKDKAPAEYLFSNRGRTVLNSVVTRICKSAGLPKVCPHSFRGLLADLALASGEVLERVAGVLGHAGVKVTTEHYANRGALDDRDRAAGHDLLQDRDRDLDRSTTDPEQDRKGPVSDDK